MKPQALNRRRNRRGMTLVEIMVVIAIVITLMGALAFGVYNSFQTAQSDVTRVTMTRVAQKVEIYYLRKKKLPADLAEVFPDEPEPLDAWNNAFILRTPGANGKKFDLISYGADGTEGGTGTNEDIKWSDS